MEVGSLLSGPDFEVQPQSVVRSDFGQREPRPMGMESDETLYAYLTRRERELTHKLAALEAQVRAINEELAHVRSASRQIGNFGGNDRKRFGVPEKVDASLAGMAKAAALMAGVNVSGAAISPEAQKALQRVAEQTASVGEGLADAARRILLGEADESSIKGMIVRALLDNFPNGATPVELREYLQNAYGRFVSRASMGPQLTRLKREGVIEHDESTGIYKCADPLKSISLATEESLKAIDIIPPQANTVKRRF